MFLSKTFLTQRPSQLGLRRFVLCERKELCFGAETHLWWEWYAMCRLSFLFFSLNKSLCACWVQGTRISDPTFWTVQQNWTLTVQGYVMFSSRVLVHVGRGSENCHLSFLFPLSSKPDPMTSPLLVLKQISLSFFLAEREFHGLAFSTPASEAERR